MAKKVRPSLATKIRPLLRLNKKKKNQKIFHAFIAPIKPKKNLGKNRVFVSRIRKEILQKFEISLN
jgi:hypothetical protein